jgi:quinol monooxygenase YgiN
MAYIYIRHRVSDYARWKSAFDAAAEMRRSAGERSYRIFRMADDPDNVMLLFEWDALEKAREYLADPDLREAMSEAGVVDIPEVRFLLEAESGQP